MSPSSSLKSVTVSSSPPPQTNISRPPFPVLVSSSSPLTIMLSLPEPSPERASFARSDCASS
jgi:hypothetical protein